MSKILGSEHIPYRTSDFLGRLIQSEMARLNLTVILGFLLEHRIPNWAPETPQGAHEGSSGIPELFRLLQTPLGEP